MVLLMGFGKEMWWVGVKRSDPRERALMVGCGLSSGSFSPRGLWVGFHVLALAGDRCLSLSLKQQ